MLDVFVGRSRYVILALLILVLSGCFPKVEELESHSAPDFTSVSIQNDSSGSYVSVSGSCGDAEALLMANAEGSGMSTVSPSSHNAEGSLSGMCTNGLIWLRYY